MMSAIGQKHQWHEQQEEQLGKAIALIDIALRLWGQMGLSILNLEIDQSLCSMCDICQFKWVVILNGYIKR